MPKKVRPVPKGFTTVTPHIALKDAQTALAFYRDARVFISDPMMNSEPSSSSIHLYVETTGGMECSTRGALRLDAWRA
jgi:hypothetical protein